MNESQITALMGILLSIVIGLIIYIFRHKDKREDETSKVLLEIKNILTNITLEIQALKIESSHNKQNQAKLEQTLNTLGTLVHTLKDKIGEMVTFRRSIEKRVGQTEKDIKFLKNKIK